MARNRNSSDEFFRPIRRILVGVFVVLLLSIFLFWRIDSPRAERLRSNIVDTIVPSFDWLLVPLATVTGMIQDFESYARIYQQNQELRRDLQQMKAWKEAALQLEQENAKLRDLNKVRLDPKLTYITGVVLADSGSPFRQSVLLNVGHRDGIVDGWPTTDGLGLVGRISGVGENSSRVVLLTDSNSRIPVTIQPSGERALLIGNNSSLPRLDFIEEPENVRAGDRVITSGDGGVFPPGLLVGQVVFANDRSYRARLSAEYERLEFLRVLRSPHAAPLKDTGTLLGPPDPEATIEPADEAAND